MENKSILKTEVMEYLPVVFELWHTDQNNPEWMVDTKVADFSSREEAEQFEKSLRVSLKFKDNVLFYQNRDGSVFKVLKDKDVVFHKLKPESFHKHNHVESDYEIQNISINDYKEWNILLSSFSSLAWCVVEKKDKKEQLVKAANGKALSFEVDLTKKTDVEFGQLLEKVNDQKPKSLAEAIEMMAKLSELNG